MISKLIIPVFIVLCSFSASSQHDVNFYGTKYSDIPIDTLPVYTGGKGELMDYISLSFRVNQSMKGQAGEARHSSIFTFVIDTLGETSELQIQNCPSSYVEKEFRRVFKGMSGWEPAIHNGEKISMQVDILFDFVISENQLMYLPQSSRLVSPKERGKKPLVKFALIGFAAVVPVFVIITALQK
jgi:hypothetical protein